MIVVDLDDITGMQPPFRVNRLIRLVRHTHVPGKDMTTAVAPHPSPCQSWSLFRTWYDQQSDLEGIAVLITECAASDWPNSPRIACSARGKIPENLHFDGAALHVKSLRNESSPSAT
jgi:hypothetical protein